MGTFFGGCSLKAFFFFIIDEQKTSEVHAASAESNYSCIVPAHLLIPHLYLHIKLMLRSPSD